MKTKGESCKMNENVIKAALLGFGTVGTGVYKVLKNQEKEMSAKIGCKVEIKKILVRNIEKAASSGSKKGLETFLYKENLYITFKFLIL